MKTIFHPADSRGHANHGWLDSHHTFSFANYHNPQRMNFGVLRVLNDDIVQGGMGFGAHPHRDMEIISIPLEGDLEHQDSTGVKGVIQKGEIQVMSAGKGVQHSEYNHNADRDVKFLQIWVFPREVGVDPRAEQISIKDGEKINDFQQIVSPNPEDEGVWIHQEGNGVYVFVIKGSAKIGNQELNKRDGFGIWDTESFHLEATEDSEILLMEVPMNLPEYLK